MNTGKGTAKRRLRSGFTTGACAAAATKAALLKLLRPEVDTSQVAIPFPDGSRHEFELFSLKADKSTVYASVIKDAGDDPDVTNGAKIGASVKLLASAPENGQDWPAILFKAGPGVGIVTRKGLAIPVGEPAINPGPRRMIRAAAREALLEAGVKGPSSTTIEIAISIEEGELLAQNTLNPRLGIKGGLSILGTTGIVQPVSAKAWTDTIDVCLSVAQKAGLCQVILSTGRTSERAVQDLVGLPDEALIMMGDYLEYAMKAAGKHGFETIHMAGMWAKIIKAALEIPQTHVRHGALDMAETAQLLAQLGLAKRLKNEVETANTARQVLEVLLENGCRDLIKQVCLKAKQYAQRLSGIPVKIYLVTAEKEVITIV